MPMTSKFLFSPFCTLKSSRCRQTLNRYSQKEMNKLQRVTALVALSGNAVKQATELSGLFPVVGINVLRMKRN